jgi:ADP-ribosyl-[dinitrogen reductase] hydrolase
VHLVQEALQGASLVDLLHGPVRVLLAAYPGFRFRGQRRENPSAYIVETLQAVFQALFDSSTFAECLVDVVNRGGDADTTGAIAGMIAGALHGVEGIPRIWLRTLDKTVHQQCQEQALALVKLSKTLAISCPEQVKGERAVSAPLRLAFSSHGSGPASFVNFPPVSSRGAPQ